MTTVFSPNFEIKLCRAMYRVLPGFKGSSQPPQTVEQARKEVLANFHLLESSSSTTKERTITETFFSHMYESNESDSPIRWIRTQKGTDYMKLVNMAIPLAKRLVSKPELRNDETVESEIIEVRKIMDSLIAEYNQIEAIVNLARARMGLSHKPSSRRG